MKYEDILEILHPLNFWGKTQDIGVKRVKYLDTFDKYIDANKVVLAVIGIRRAGKTYLTKQLLDLKCSQFSKETTLYVLLEDPKFEPYLNLDLLNDIYQSYRTFINRKGPCYIVLDEIQNIEHWEKWVRATLEKNNDVKIIITGSSSKLLSSSLAKVLTGRTITQNIFPLSFKEFLSFKGLMLDKDYDIVVKKEQIKQMLTEYILYGGFPQIVLEDNISVKTQLLKELFEGIILRDVVSRHRIRDVHTIKTAAELAINNFAGLISASKLRKILVNILGRKISPNLVLDILSHLEEAFLIFQLPILSYKVKERKQYPKKIYCIDNGIINTAIIKFTDNIGRLFENTVALSLLKKNGIENIFYWKSRQGKEVDFVIKEGMRIRQLIQVSYNISEKKTKDREIDALLAAGEELDCNNFLVITDEYGEVETLGDYKICFIPLWKWLMEE